MKNKSQKRTKTLYRVCLCLTILLICGELYSWQSNKGLIDVMTTKQWSFIAAISFTMGALLLWRIHVCVQDLLDDHVDIYRAITKENGND